MTIDLTLAHGPDLGAIHVNEDWCVLPDGLEHRGNGYFIAREALAARRGCLWEWPLHLAEKTWCRPRLLREAFVVALSRFAIAQDAQLTRSFALGFGIRSDGQTESDGRQGSQDTFVRLGDVVRPKPAKGLAKKGLAKGAAKAAEREHPVARETGKRRVAA